MLTVTPKRCKISTIELVTSHQAFMQEGLSRAGNGIKEELQRIIRREKALEHQNIDVIEKLYKLPLGSLSQHVRAELDLSQTANSPSDRSIRNWKHHAHQRIDKSVSEFDRFVSASSGVVGLLASADAQYGGIATATLSLLFSVSI
jgi:hypothetical protein